MTTACPCDPSHNLLCPSFGILTHCQYSANHQKSPLQCRTPWPFASFQRDLDPLARFQSAAPFDGIRTTPRHAVKRILTKSLSLFLQNSCDIGFRCCNGRNLIMFNQKTEDIRRNKCRKCWPQSNVLNSKI